MQQNLIQQKCQTHQQEIIAFDLDPLAQLKDRYLCIDCLATQAPYRQTKTIKDAQQKFKEMTMSEFNNKKIQITQNITKLSTLQKNIEEFQEIFKNKISESIQILNQKITEVQNELNNLNEPSYEMQNEQDLINLSNYVNYGFNKNNNQTNPKQHSFLNLILQLLDYSKFEEHLINISNQMEQIQIQSLIEEQVKLIPQNQSYIDFKKQINLRYQCLIHKAEITMLCIEPGQIEERFFCQNCVKEKNKKQLKTIQDVNKLWQSHIQNIHISNRNFYNLRQYNQNKVTELIVKYQKFIQEFFNGLHKLIINQNNKIIKEKNDSESSILNKQLFQMELKEIELITKTLSQNDPIQEVVQKQFQIQKEDRQYIDQIQEQLNIKLKKLMEIQLQIKQLFLLDLSIKQLNYDQLEQYFSKELFPQFLDKYSKFQNQYKIIIDKLKSKIEIPQIQNINQKSNHLKENQIQQCKQILEQMYLIEKVRLQQVSFSTHKLYKQFKFQIKRSQNNLKTQNLHIQQKFQISRSSNNLQAQNLHIQQKYLVTQKILLIFEQINNKYKKDVKFSDQLKHQIIQLNDNHKIAQYINNNQICAACLCDQPIPMIGTFSVAFKINKLHDIMIGKCNSKFIKQDFNFNNQQNTLHGYYVLGNCGYGYSHHDSSQNSKQFGFSFKQGDIINVEVNQSTKKIFWRNIAKGLSCSLDFQPSEYLHFCCCLFSYDKSMNEVEII